MKAVWVFLVWGYVSSALVSSAFSQTWREEFQWNQLNPEGVQDWTNGNNWLAPAAPPGNTEYPDDPEHEDEDPDILAPVVGANLSVALTADLEVQLGQDVTIASLSLGVKRPSYDHQWGWPPAFCS